MSTLNQFFRGSGRFRDNKQWYLRSGSYTFTVPNGIDEVLAVAIGAGGGGHWHSSTSGTAAGGGGGGGYAQGVIAVVPGQTIAVTVGTEGVSNDSGQAGTSSFGSFLSATGGYGGSATSPGNGGAGSSSGATEVFTSSGGQGGGLHTSQFDASGGGSSGSPYGDGTQANKPANITASCTAGAAWNGLDADERCTDNNMNGVEGGQGTANWGGYGRGRGSYTTGMATGGPGLFAGKLGEGQGCQDVNKSYIDTVVRGSHGACNYWWFPWEIGGGGGGGAYAIQTGSTVTAGSGGCGAGGGSASCEATSSASCAGMGGFGGGGGASASNVSSSYPFAGHGGHGGGGGGTTAYNSSLYPNKVGFGGPGAVLVYY